MPKVCLMIGWDIGDDNRLWYTHDYTYTQSRCQWKTDFNGDELFCMYFYDLSKKQFVPMFEEPFAHYDTDRDGLAEITVRVVGDRRCYGFAGWQSKL